MQRLDSGAAPAPARPGIARHAFTLLTRGLAGELAALHAFVDLMSADAVLWLPPTPNTHSPYRGREAIRALLADFVVPLYRDGLHLTLHHVLEGDGRTLFQFEDRGVMARDATPYENAPCITLAESGGAITGFWEYWGGPGFFGAVPGDVAPPADPAAHAAACAAFAQLQQGLAGDAAALTRFVNALDDEVRLWFPPTPNTRSPYRGRAAAEHLFRELLVPMYPRGLFVRRFHVLAGGTRTAFELQSCGIRRDGSEYLNSPCLCFDMHAGRIRSIWEHWGGPGFFAPTVRFDSMQ
jgi:ketosteroid isomerase-like protein